MPCCQIIDTENGTWAPGQDAGNGWKNVERVGDEMTYYSLIFRHLFKWKCAQTIGAEYSCNVCWQSKIDKKDPEGSNVWENLHPYGTGSTSYHGYVINEGCTGEWLSTDDVEITLPDHDISGYGYRVTVCYLPCDKCNTDTPETDRIHQVTYVYYTP